MRDNIEERIYIDSMQVSIPRGSRNAERNEAQINCVKSKHTHASQYNFSSDRARIFINLYNLRRLVQPISLSNNLPNKIYRYMNHQLTVRSFQLRPFHALIHHVL